MASPRLARKHRKGFPDSLVSAPILLPAEGTALRGSLESWFQERTLRPNIVGEFDDSALLKVFGQAGMGVFAVPSVIEEEVARQYNARRVGLATGITERFYAISLERKIKNLAVAAICEVARTEFFASTSDATGSRTASS